MNNSDKAVCKHKFVVYTRDLKDQTKPNHTKTKQKYPTPMHKYSRSTIWCVFLESSECDKMDTHIIKADNNLVHSFPQTARGTILPV